MILKKYRNKSIENGKKIKYGKGRKEGKIGMNIKWKASKERKRRLRERKIKKLKRRRKVKGRRKK